MNARPWMITMDKGDGKESLVYGEGDKITTRETYKWFELPDQVETKTSTKNP